MSNLNTREILSFEEKNNNIKVAVLEAAKPYLIAALYHTQQRPMLIITAQPENSRKLHEQLQIWCNSTQGKLLPEPDTLPYQHVTADTSTGLEWIQVLSALLNQTSVNHPLIVTSFVTIAP